ncbi:MAG TPA: Xaa-Pro aminopeptidase [Polyangiaceae bacterium]|nr:Xaa-Pro aminopeptidase [Polyangiaceae bacterium]
MQSAAEVFTQRRQRLAGLIERAGIEHAVLASGWARPRNFAHNVFPFRAESHFLYAIGRHIEGAVLSFEDGSPRLYVTARDPEMALWEGPKPSCEELSSQLGLEVLPLDEFAVAPDAACVPPQDDESSNWLSALLERDVEAQSGPHLESADAALADALVELRLVHDAAALAQLRWAGEVSAGAHRSGMRATRGARWEFEVRGAMEGHILAAGMRTSYESIVSTRGEILHVTDSRGALLPGELLLCDVGAETPEGWAGDITRTWPTAGKFSSSQREIYELVLGVQQAAIDAVRAGVRFRELHRAAGRSLGAGLVELGILRGNAEELYERGVVAVFFPHGLGHLLGLDVHDMEDLGDRAGYAAGLQRSESPGESALRLDRVLEVDQVVTIEPGFYRSPLLLARARADRHVRDAIDWSRLEAFSDVRGIRIEDDVRVTNERAEVLSAAAPKTIADLERIVRGE